MGGSVEKREVQLFLKRLRSLLGGDRCRYFAVGEYGDASMRPHYHLTLFGPDRADFPELVALAWRDKEGAPIGFVHVGLGGPSSMAYVAQYTVKKMTKKDDGRLEGRKPEFALMSRHPGLGADAAPMLARFWKTELGREEFWSKGGVSKEFRSEGQVWPIDRYVREIIAREAKLGRPEFDGLTWMVLKMREAMCRPLLTREELAVKRKEAFLKGERRARQRAERQRL